MLQAPLLEASGRPAPHTATKLLVSHALTKLGSKAWEFATPLLLLRFSPGSLLAPTVFGLTIFLFRCAPARRARTRVRTSDSAAATRLRMTRPPPCIACPRHPAPTGAPVQRPAPTGPPPPFPRRFLLGPVAGTWMDRTARLRVVRTGIALQALGVCLALLVFAPIALEITSATWILPLLLPLITMCGCCEARDP